MLRQRVLSATLWSAADVSLRHGLQFGVLIVLARLVSPEEFGTLALLYLFTGIASAFTDGGFSAALIQRQVVSHTDESTVFWFNLAMGSLAAACLWALGPTVAGYYELPLLAPLAAALAVNVVLSALGSLPATLLMRRLDFRLQLKLGVVANSASGGVAILAAWYGFGVWALVAQTVTSTAMTTLLLWVYVRWRPAMEFSLVSARRLFSFGGYLLGCALLDTIYSRTYTLLIGHLYGVRALGFYNRADNTKQLTSGMLTVIFSRVAFPAFSEIAHDVPQLRRGMQAAIRAVTLINTPMMLGIAAVARPMVLAAFGARWLPAVPMLQVLCLGALFTPLHMINLSALMATGHAHLCFRIEIIKKLLGLTLLAIGTFYGVLGIAWSQAAFGTLTFGINTYYTRRLLSYGAAAQLRDFLPVVVIASPMAWCIHWLDVHWLEAHAGSAPAAQLLGLIALGVLAFFGGSWLFRLAALQDALNLIRRRNVLVSEVP